MTSNVVVMKQRTARATAERTDLGNSERLVKLHGAGLRYVPEWGKFAVYNGTCWAVGDSSTALSLATDTARAMFAAAVAALERCGKAAGADDEGRSKKLAAAQRAIAWAIKSQAASRLHAMLDLAKADPSVVAHHHELDVDVMLLNCQNATIDLRTGKPRAHRPEDLITKLAPVIFDPRAKCPTWERFLARSMRDNAELLAFLRRLVGYTLTGSIREHVLGFFFGDGANGKSTFIRIAHALFGSYAARAPRGMLFKAKGEKHTTDITTLHGARFVSCAEVEEGEAFDEALVKDLTGGDPITARRMREDNWTFPPTHKLFLAGNHKPSVRGDDEGVWRRVLLVPWTNTIPEAERDADLAEKLLAELPGILNWAIAGCLEWQASGLGVPPLVREATAAYREESDPVREFFDLWCVFGATEEAKVARRVLRKRYEAYCDENGAHPVGAHKFASRLRRRIAKDAGYEGADQETKVRVDGVPNDAWRGVRLKTDEERGKTPTNGVGSSEIVGASSRIAEYVSSEIGDDGGNPHYQVTTHYKPEDAQNSFGDYLDREGVGGPK